MPAGIMSFLHHQADAARDFLSGAADRGADAASRWGGTLSHTVSDYAGRIGAGSADAATAAERKLRQYGLTPEMVAGLAAPQLRHLQKVAARQAQRNATPLIGSVIALGAMALIAYAIAREEKLAAPYVNRSGGN